jgi:hypothetical protein
MLSETSQWHTTMPVGGGIHAINKAVDGGQHKMGSYTHADAEVIAATVAGMSQTRLPCRRPRYLL